MSNNTLKKMLVFSDNEIKEHIEEWLKSEAKRSCDSASKIAEECILQAMAMDDDDWAKKVLESRYSKRVAFLNNLK